MDVDEPVYLGDVTRELVEEFPNTRFIRGEFEPGEASRRCSWCRVWLPLNGDYFHRYARLTPPFGYRCKECTVVGNRRYRRRPEYRTQARRYERKRNYGLSGVDFARLIELQGDRCAICAADFGDDVQPAVDHDHRDGHIRGLLCMKCNTGIGMLADDAERCRIAAEYLERN